MKLIILSFLLVAITATSSFAQEAVLPSGSNKAPEDATVLSGVEVLARLKGKNAVVGEVLNPDGTAKLLAVRYLFKGEKEGYMYANYMSFSDSGKWRIENDLLCTQLNRWSPKGSCSQVSESKDGTTVFIGSWYRGKWD